MTGNNIKVTVWEKVLIHRWPAFSNKNLINMLVKSKNKISLDLESENLITSKILNDWPKTIEKKVISWNWPINIQLTNG